MSYIDTFDHEYCGQIGYIPIYHPLQAVDDGDEFNCDPSCLVLGGGSGEHPALVIKRLDYLVALFLLEIINDENETIVGIDTFRFLQDISCESDPYRFEDWSVRHFAALLEMARSNLNWKPIEDNQSVEDWLFTSIGEFVYFSLPELNPLPEYILEKFRLIEVLPVMRNVTCLPPGYPDFHGRVVENGQLIWGKRRF
jgi:hypothetical protein